MTNSRRADVILRGFGVRLRACRIAAGFETADEFAKLLGIETPRYRKYERGGSLPPVDVLDQILDHFDRSADWLIFGRGGLAREVTGDD